MLKFLYSLGHAGISLSRFATGVGTAIIIGVSIIQFIRNKDDESTK